jgi:hypothetical protein
MDNGRSGEEVQNIKAFDGQWAIAIELTEIEHAKGDVRKRGYQSRSSMEVNFL